MIFIFRLPLFWFIFVFFLAMQCIQFCNNLFHNRRILKNPLIGWHFCNVYGMIMHNFYRYTEVIQIIKKRDRYQNNQNTCKEFVFSFHLWLLFKCTLNPNAEICRNHTKFYFSFLNFLKMIIFLFYGFCGKNLYKLYIY